MGVRGIGGLFFRSADPEALGEWYRAHLNVGPGCTGDPASQPQEWSWQAEGGPVVFAPFPADSDYFAADRQSMLNLRVEDIDALIASLGESGVAVETRAEWDDAGIGRFARLHDPEGNPIELWEPPAPDAPPIPAITAFASSPDRGRGLARDMQVRWALEEVGQTYEVELVSFGEMKQPEYLRLQPFGQIPTYREGDLVLFESGAIVLHIAQSRAGLLPAQPEPRARATAWLIAALSTLEPPIIELQNAILLERDRPWHAERLPQVQDRIRARLNGLSEALGEREWLEVEFSAGDLMTIGVLRRLASSGLLDEFPNVAAYIARGEARPAFQRAFAAQLAVFEEGRERRGE